MRPIADRVREVISPLMEALGYVLLDVTVFRHRGRSAVKMTIHRAAGVGIDDCAQVSRQAHPLLETMEELGDCSLEVSSPGAGRLLKGPAEYGIFLGRGAEVLITDESEWRKGVIHQADGNHLFLKREGAIVQIPYEKIKRVKLAFVKEEGGSHVF
jgi:ribosome maturation factor RimP